MAKDLEINMLRGVGEGVLLYISHIGFVLSPRVAAPFWSGNGY